MCRLWRVLLVVPFMMAAAPGALGAGIGWKSLPYFDYTTNHLFVATDGSWEGAHVVQMPALRPFPPSQPFYGRGVRNEYIWTAFCNAAPQNASFVKQIESPGVPYSGVITLQYGRSGVGMQKPYTSAALLVNGAPVAQLGPADAAPNVGGYRTVHLPAAALHAFRYGLNTLTIRVQKTALPRGEACTIPSAPGGRLRYVGVNASLDLTYGSDLEALPSFQGPYQLSRGITPGQPVLITGTINVQNNGPSASLAGTIVVTVSGYGTPRAIVDPNKAGVQSTLCTAIPPSFTELDCPYQELQAGQKISLPVAVKLNVPQDFRSYSVETATLQWVARQTNVNPVTMLKSSNQHVFVLCGPNATNTCHP